MLTNIATAAHKARAAQRRSSQSSLTALSLGAGVQSTTMALMAAHGEIKRPDVAIFADTQWEPAAVYTHLQWLMSVLPFPVNVVTAGSIRDGIVNRKNTTNGSYDPIPWHTVDDQGQPGMGRRQCTSEYKLKPIFKEIRRLLGNPRGRISANSVTVMIGISLDESWRMKASQTQYIVNTWPLVELNISRADCYQWLESHGYPKPPKSACKGCPYHDNKQWVELRDNSPDDWLDAVRIDKLLRQRGGLAVQEFAHFSRVPLDEADLTIHQNPPNLFINECEGMCGV